MAGYSATPLAKKLGFKEGFRAGLVNAPKGFRRELNPLPTKVTIAIGLPEGPLDLVLFFADSKDQLKNAFPILVRKLPANGMLWIAWRKKSSHVATDLSDDSVRQIGLDAGLVDVKVCAINDIWSGLKFVYRLQDRKAR